MQTHSLSSGEKRDWLRLIRTQNIGPITFHQLIARFGSASEALKQIPAYAKASGRKKPFTLAAAELVHAELERGEEFNATLLCSCEPDYPVALRNIPDPPPVIWVKGSIELLSRHSVAIVGARNASSVGKRMARTLAKDLSEAGFIIVSGLARGIDGAAHEAALSTGTVAAVAGGIDIIYPPEHAELTQAIAREGAIVSEMPMGYQPTARDFPKRNRIISGLSLGTIVVEAAAKSGTLITARLANEQGRDVFAVPGSPLDPRCHGTNRLLRDGATLIENAQDVLDSLQETTRRMREPGQGSLFDTPAQDITPETRKSVIEKILEVLSYTPIHRDTLIREVGEPPALIADALLDLILSGQVEELAGGLFSLSPSGD